MTWRDWWTYAALCVGFSVVFSATALGLLMVKPGIVWTWWIAVDTFLVFLFPAFLATTYVYSKREKG